MSIEQTSAPGGSAELAPVRHQTVQLASGLRVRYAAQGEPGGEPLVLVHGWPDSWFSYSRVLAHLSPERYRAYAYDQRGFGATDRPSEGYAIDQFATDLVAFLDAVGLERASLVGHSFGSFVARRAAELHPQRVSRLVLI